MNKHKGHAHSQILAEREREREREREMPNHPNRVWCIPSSFEFFSIKEGENVICIDLRRGGDDDLVAR